MEPPRLPSLLEHLDVSACWTFVSDRTSDRPASPSHVKIAQVVYWQHFEASEWDIEYDLGKLASHGISDWEAEEVIFNMFVARPNKKVHGPDRYQLVGRTDAGRALLLIVHVFGERQMRVLNGWPL